MSILVTGSQGFVGQYIVAQLVAAGESVVGYDRRGANSPAGSKLAHVQGDLNDLPLLLETALKYEVGRIIHTAAISHPMASRDIPYQTVMVNAVGTTNIFELARLLGIRRVVNFSSECVYGNNDQLQPVYEDSPLEPTTPYGATKVFGEKLAQVYNGLYGMEILSLRPGWIYGPGQFMQCYLKTLLRNALDGVTTVEQSGADYRFQYVHAADVANAAVLAANVAMPPFSVFNITAGVQHSYAEVVALVREQLPQARVELGPGSIEILDRNGCFDIGRARQHLGYQPQISLQDGIRQYADWLASHDF